MPDEPAVQGQLHHHGSEPNIAVVSILCGICLFASLYVVSGAWWAATIAIACLLALPVAGWQLMKLRERYLLGLATIVALLVLLFNDTPAEIYRTALERASYLAAFIMILSLLRDAAMTSESVLAVGKMLTRQPPGRRYWTIALGGHAMGVIMNFGALSLLGPLVQRGARAGGEGVDPRITAVRERRQLSALARGFSWFIAWSPSAISQVVAVTVVTGASSANVALYGSIAAVLVIIAGWLDDRAVGTKARRRLTGGQPLQPLPSEPFPTTEIRRLLLVYATLAAASAAIAISLSLPLVTGIMLAATPVTLVWIYGQIASGRADKRSFSVRARDLAMKTIPDGSPEAITLALAGFSGTALAILVPGGENGSAGFLRELPPFFTYLFVLTTVPVASLAGLPAMLMVTFLGTFLSGALGDHINPDLLALSLICGWAVNLNASPFGGTNLILSRITGIPATTLSFRWNLVFSLMAWAICALVLLISSVLTW